MISQKPREQHANKWALLRIGQEGWMEQGKRWGWNGDGMGMGWDDMVTWDEMIGWWCGIDVVRWDAWGRMIWVRWNRMDGMGMV